MDKKLTLSLDKHIIEKAKEYAKMNGTSLSKMIESYFQSLINKQLDDSENPITPLVDSLSGVGKFADDFDFQKERSKYLDRKYK